LRHVTVREEHTWSTRAKFMLSIWERPLNLLTAISILAIHSLSHARFASQAATVCNQHSKKCLQTQQDQAKLTLGPLDFVVICVHVIFVHQVSQGSSCVSILRQTQSNEFGPRPVQGELLHTIFTASSLSHLKASVPNQMHTSWPKQGRRLLVKNICS